MHSWERSLLDFLLHSILRRIFLHCSAVILILFIMPLLYLFFKKTITQIKFSFRILLSFQDWAKPSLAVDNNEILVECTTPTFKLFTLISLYQAKIRCDKDKGAILVVCIIKVEVGWSSPIFFCLFVINIVIFCKTLYAGLQCRQVWNWFI